MSSDEINSIMVDNYLLQVYKAYGHNEQSVNALKEIAISLNDIYRYFEPGFFKGNVYVVKHFSDALVLDEQRGTPIYHDKNILQNKNAGTLIIQIFGDGKLMLWENEDVTPLLKKSDSLVYHYCDNKELLYANQSEFDITKYPFGSRYATQFIDLVEALNTYALKKIYYSSCPHFSQSWHNEKRIFFKGEGSGSDSPEKYMQQSLHQFLETYFSRGNTIEAIREYNVGGGKPKPVDIRIHWRVANRIALIEIKFLGVVRGNTGAITTRYDNPRVNTGITQLKGYYDKAVADLPTTIIKSFLIVIDGRRNNLLESTTDVTNTDGMHYKDTPLIIDDDKKFHESNPAFEKPIKMFATPVCI